MAVIHSNILIPSEELHRAIMDNFLDQLIYVGKNSQDCATSVSSALANLTLDGTSFH